MAAAALMAASRLMLLLVLRLVSRNRRGVLPRESPATEKVDSSRPREQQWDSLYSTVLKNSRNIWPTSASRAGPVAG
jgi:hypothetical protein